MWMLNLGNSNFDFLLVLLHISKFANDFYIYGLPVPFCNHIAVRNIPMHNLHICHQIKDNRHFQKYQPKPFVIDISVVFLCQKFIRSFSTLSLCSCWIWRLTIRVHAVAVTSIYVHVDRLSCQVYIWFCLWYACVNFLFFDHLPNKGQT